MASNISRNDFIKIWGKDNCVSINSEALLNVKISQLCKIFLTEYGMPRVANELLFELPLKSTNFQSLTTMIPENKGHDKTLNDLRLIGMEDKRMYVCIDEQNQGAIVSIDFENNPPSKAFINSSISKFIKSLTIHRLHWRKNKIENLIENDIEYHQAVKELESNLKIIDSKALKNENNFWSLVLEHMYNQIWLDEEEGR